MVTRPVLEKVSAFRAPTVSEAASIIWRRLYWVLVGASLMVATGAFFAFTSTPVYKAFAVIAPKKSEAPSGGGLFSQLGGLSAQLGLANSNLNRIEVLLRSRDLAREIVVIHPVNEVVYPKMWDAGKGAWKPKYAKVHPDSEETAELLSDLLIEPVVNPKKEILTLTAKAPTPEGAVKLVEFYLAELNNRMRRDVVREAETNRKFLEEQISLAADPLIREKIQELIATQVERAMLVSYNSFDVLQKPFLPRYRISPKRGQILVLSLLAGLILSSLVVVGFEVANRAWHGKNWKSADGGG